MSNLDDDPPGAEISFLESSGTPKISFRQDRERQNARKGCRKSWILAALLIVLLTLAFVTFLIMFLMERKVSAKLMAKGGRHTQTESKAVTDDLSISADHVIIAARMIEKMDLSVDPCNNFYDYACNGWQRNTDIPDTASSVTQLGELARKNGLVVKKILGQLVDGKQNASTDALRKTADFYESCMDTERIEKIGDSPIKDYIRKLGSWPVTDPEFDATSSNASLNIVRTLAEIHREFEDIFPLFWMSISPNYRNTTLNIITFAQGGLTADRETYLQNSSYYQARRKSLIAWMEGTASVLGANETGIRIMKQVFDFEQQLAKISLSVEQQRNVTTYESVSLGELINKTGIPGTWMTTFLKHLTGKDIPLSEIVGSAHTKLLGDVYRLFTNQSIV